MKELKSDLRLMIERLLEHYEYSNVKNISLIFIAFIYFYRCDVGFRNELTKQKFNLDDTIKNYILKDVIFTFRRWLEKKKPNLCDVYSETFEFVLLSLENNKVDCTAASDYLFFLLSTVKIDSDKTQSDVIPVVFGYALSIFSELQLKAVGESYTPESITSLLIRLLDLKPGETLFDPVCGSGSFLTYANNLMKADGGITVFGSDNNFDAIRVAKLNFLINGLDPKNVKQGNALLNFKYETSSPSTENYDAICADPPFSLKNWFSNSNSDDLQDIYKFGIPPNSNADYAFIQSIISKLSDNGRSTILAAQGVLFRGGQEGEIRRNLILKGCIETVIQLPSNLLPNTRIPVVVLVLRKERELKDVFFIDATNLFELKNRINVLSESNIAEILNTYIIRQSKNGFSRMVKFDELEQNDFNLSTARYIKKDCEKNEEPLDVLIDKQKALYKKLNDVHTKYFLQLDD